MPLVFQQTLRVGGSGEEGEGQEVVWATPLDKGPVRRARTFFV